MKKIFSYAPKPFKKMPLGTKKLEIINSILVVNRDKNGKKISNKEFLKRVKEIIRKNPEAFEALEEYDRTRRLPTIEELKKLKKLKKQ